MRNQKKWPDVVFGERAKVFWGLLLAFCVHQAATRPWKLRNQEITGKFTLCATSESVFSLHWTGSARMPGWLPNLNVGCQLKPEICTSLASHQEGPQILEKYAKNMTLIAVIFHPLQWLKGKTIDLPHFWPGGRVWSESLNEAGWSGAFDLMRQRGFFWFVFEGIAFLVFFGVALIGSILQTRKSGWLQRRWTFSLLCLGFFLAHALVFLVAGFEVRYSLYLRVLSFVWICTFALDGFIRKESSQRLGA